MSKQEYKNFNEMVALASSAILRYLSGFNIQEAPYPMEESDLGIKTIARRPLSAIEAVKSARWIAQEVGRDAKERFRDEYAQLKWLP